MTTTTTAAPTQQPPQAPPFMDLLKTLAGPWLSQSIYVLAKLDVPEQLADGPLEVSDLAARSGADADALQRFMRAAAMAGVVTEVAPRRFALTPQGHFLRGDVPGSQKWSAIMFGEETFRAWGSVMHTARTGAPAFDEVYGRSYFDYIGDHPEAKQVFNAAMRTSGEAPLAKLYDFTGIRRVIDVGGGQGTLLGSILRAHPELEGVLVDLPDVVSGAGAQLDDVADRCEIVAGSFFDAGVVPRGGDLLILSRVLHDWDDDNVLAILGNVREAMDEGAKVLVLERLIPPGDDFHFGKLFDLVMLVVLGGRDRSEDEYRTLLTRAGLQPGPALAMPNGMGAIESVRASS
jgi:O-methyltransferase domain